MKTLYRDFRVINGIAESNYCDQDVGYLNNNTQRYLMTGSWQEIFAVFKLFQKVGIQQLWILCSG